MLMFDCHVQWAVRCHADAMWLGFFIWADSRPAGCIVGRAKNFREKVRELQEELEEAKAVMEVRLSSSLAPSVPSPSTVPDHLVPHLPRSSLQMYLNMHSPARSFRAISLPLFLKP